jgi:hypothetical protein
VNFVRENPDRHARVTGHDAIDIVRTCIEDANPGDVAVVSDGADDSHETGLAQSEIALAVLPDDFRDGRIPVGTRPRKVGPSLENHDRIGLGRGQCGFQRVIADFGQLTVVRVPHDWTAPFDKPIT